MKRIHRKQLTLALPMLGAMVLAAAVFVWGSQYKCSLYHRHPEKHARIPVAKLLSERERPVAAQETASTHAPLLQAVFPAFGLLLSALFRTVRPGFDRVVLAIQSDIWPRRTPSLIHFSFRPPPATVL